MVNRPCSNHRSFISRFLVFVNLWSFVLDQVFYSCLRKVLPDCMHWVKQRKEHQFRQVSLQEVMLFNPLWIDPQSWKFIPSPRWTWHRSRNPKWRPTFIAACQGNYQKIFDHEAFALWTGFYANCYSKRKVGLTPAIKQNDFI